MESFLAGYAALAAHQSSLLLNIEPLHHVVQPMQAKPVYVCKARVRGGIACA